MSHVWMATFVNALAKEKLVTKGELLVKQRKCLVVDPDTKDVKLKLLWLPQHLENRRVVEALEQYGTVKSINREKWRCPGLEHIDTLNREVVLTLNESTTVSRVPHLLNVFGCQSLVIIPGRPPLCLRCNRHGHVRRQCRTARCAECHRYGHSAGECAFTYADKLRQGAGPNNSEAAEHLMDVSEVVDATGELCSIDQPQVPPQDTPVHPRDEHGQSTQREDSEVTPTTQPIQEVTATKQHATWPELVSAEQGDHSDSAVSAEMQTSTTFTPSGTPTKRSASPSTDSPCKSSNPSAAKTRVTEVGEGKRKPSGVRAVPYAKHHGQLKMPNESPKDDELC